MNSTTRAQESVAELVDELADAERLVDEEAERIEALKAQIAGLRSLVHLHDEGVPVAG